MLNPAPKSNTNQADLAQKHTRAITQVMKTRVSPVSFLFSKLTNGN